MRRKPLFLLLSLSLLVFTSCGQSSSVTEESSEAPSSVAESSSSSSSKDNFTGDIYVAAKGVYTASGTKDSPCNLTRAIEELRPGKTIYMLAGTYSYSSTVAINSTTEGYPATSKDEMKTLMPAFNTDGSEQKVLFDFSAMPFYSSNRGLSFDSNYWHAKDFEVMGAGDNGVYIGGNHNVIENLDIHDCQDTGLQLGRSSSALNSIEVWPSYNTILNVTSHDNHDPTGEDSDGFACKLTTGVGNVFNGCIAYNNVDDGWDLYTKGESGPIGPVTIENCVAFNNGITAQGVGTANSDGNGFKLGGENIPVQHIVKNCIAFNNLATGFTDNSNPGTIRIENCTSYNNGTRDLDAPNFDLCRDRDTSENYYKNLLSYCSGTRTNPITLTTAPANSKDQYKGTVSYSVFYYGLSTLKFTDIQECDYYVESLRGTLFEPNKAPFVSTVTPQIQSSKNVPATTIADIHTTLRDATTHNIKLGDFLKVDSTSDFATMGESSSCLGANLSSGTYVE